MPAEPDTQQSGGRQWWIWPILLATALACGLGGVWLGWTLLAQRLAGQTVTAQIVDQPAAREQLEVQQQINAVLEREIGEARQTLAGSICTAENPLGLVVTEAVQERLQQA